MAVVSESAVELGVSVCSLRLFAIAQCAHAARCQKLLGRSKSLTSEVSRSVILSDGESYIQRAERWRTNRTHRDGSGLCLCFRGEKTGRTLHLANLLSERGQRFSGKTNSRSKSRG